MLNSIYLSSAGMMNFDKGLSNISGNVGNLNTTGYKKTDLAFSELIYEGTGGSIPGGISQSQVNYSQGDVQASDEDTHLAIEGEGYFILAGDEVSYTRSGRFAFNADGDLVSEEDEKKVSVLDDDGRLTTLNIRDHRAVDAQPTEEITLTGNLSNGGVTHEIESIDVIDARGTERALRFRFTNNTNATEGSWLIDVFDEDGNELAADLEIRFASNGSPQDGFNQVEFELTSDDERTSVIRIFIGDVDRFDQLTNFTSGSTSSAEIDETDGVTAGVLAGIEINENGQFVFNYTNGDTETGPDVALAVFSDLSQLKSTGGSRFVLTAQGDSPDIVSARTSGVADVQSGKLEQSNVDLTDEFSQMIIVQRGYQASSQIMTTANEMLQQLLESTSK